ncbi:MAG: phosphatidate cytidylyltransferase [Azoarcus sp.]|nr:phosphatidate cytidylyltransferase [Azoarcus sp.]
MLKTRIITAACLLAVLLGALFYLPPMAWFAFCSLICALAAGEWGALAGWGGRARIVYAVALGVVCFISLEPMVADCIFNFCQSKPPLNAILPIHFAFYLIAAVFWLLCVPFWLRYKWPLRKWNAALTGFIVLVPSVAAFALLRRLEPLFLIAVVAVFWVADIAAYFTGRAFGGIRLAPNISPGKTWAGAVGAVIGVLFYCNVLMLTVFMNDFSGNFLRLLLLQPLFIGLAVMSIVGDLFESLLKRQAGVKDSSNLLPGHGGVLDRIDSLTSTLPLIAVFCIWF